MANSDNGEDNGGQREQVGQHISQYRLVRLLGSGEFADVYLGEHIQSNLPVAIKVLHTQLNDNDMQQFLAQTSLLAQLHHAHIVRILDYGMEHETPFLIMDYAPHGSLRQRHPRGSRLPLATIVYYVNQIVDALQYIHNQNLIHRDIKPHNMLVGVNHKILLSDFGIAVLSQSMGYRRQSVQDFEGTILYAAPEQIRSLPRIASDQYALAVVVYEWLCGTWPFHGTVDEIASQHVLAPPPSLLATVPSLPAAVEQVVFKALAKDPYQRFENVLEFARALERASRLEGIQQPTRHSISPLSPMPRTPSSPGIQTTSPVAHLTYRGHADKIHILVWSPGGHAIASSSEDETVQVWDAQSGQTLVNKRGDSLQAQAIAWSPDGTYIAATSGLLSDSVQIWDAATGQDSSIHARYSGHSETIQALAWSPDSTYIASAGDDGTVQVWHVTTGRTVFTYRGHTKQSEHTVAIKTLAWSPDGKRIASSGDDKRVHVWDALTGGNIIVYYAHSDTINALTWTPGSTHIASASDDRTIHMWDGSTARKVFIYTGHNDSVTDVAWSPDGIRIASSSRDETVHIWHALTGRTLTTYTGHTDWASTVEWSPDGKSIASGSWDKTVQVWEV
ncbi:MAG TPA: serine/threonine-protein kinase [Ktedonobacteraceae bacterium]|nr:serine/threonine-protein kinase [Ktedonobacteraceae bacterium]